VGELFKIMAQLMDKVPMGWRIFFIFILVLTPIITVFIKVAVPLMHQDVREAYPVGEPHMEEPCDPHNDPECILEEPPKDGRMPEEHGHEHEHEPPPEEYEPMFVDEEFE